MSKQVDERIVKMQFDNAEFESRAKNTISTLTSLSSALQFPDGSKGLDQIQRSSQRLDFSALNSAIETVNYRFSLLGSIAFNVFDRIVNKAVDTGSRLVKALTITPATDGFSEYELKMESVKRILNSAKDEDGLPVTLGQVNAKLDELNRYADKTIYSFSDMTSNIGKFTNAGVDLDKAVLAIQGISNEAALSGANAQEASRAMYNFAQALSAGYIKLIDWKSIENANMATVSFKEELIKTALELGTIKKKGDKYVSTTKDMTGKVSEAFDATTLFNESLAHQWMTSEVLTTTLAKYADETTDLGKAAFKAATEVTTFHKLLDTLKEALGSGWAQTWELVFGDFEESKRLWTAINNVLSNAINASADARNGILEDWDALGGRAILITGLVRAWEGLVNIGSEFKSVLDEIVPKITERTLFDLSVRVRDLASNFRNFTHREAKTFHNIFEGLGAVVRIFCQIISAVGRTVAPALGPLSDFAYSIFSSTGTLGEWLQKLADSAEESDFFYEKLQQLLSPFQKLIDYIQNAIDKLDELTGFKEKFSSAKDSIFGAIFGKEEVVDNTERFHKGPVEVIRTTYSEFKKLQDEKGTLSGVLGIIERFRNAISNFINSVRDSEPLQRIATIFTNLADAILNFTQKIGGAVIDGIVAFAERFKEVFSGGFNKENIERLLGAGLIGLIAAKAKKIIEYIKSPLDFIKDIFEGKSMLAKTLEDLGEAMGDFLDNLGDAIEAFKSKVQIENMKKIAEAVAILVGAVVVLSFIDPGKLTVSIIAMAFVMAELVGVMAALDKILDSKGSMKITAFSAFAIAFSAAMLILAGAVKILGTIEGESLLNGILAVGALMAMMIIVSQLGGKNFSSKGLLGLSISLVIIAKVVKDLGALDIDALYNGMEATILLMVVMGALSVLGGSNFSSKGFLGMAVSILIISKVVKELGAMDKDALYNGMEATLLLMVVMGGLSVLGGANFSSRGLLFMSIAILILKGVIVELGTLDLASLAKGVGAVGVLMLFIGLLSKFGGKNFGAAFAVAAMAKSMTVLADVVQIFGSMPLEHLAKGLAALAVGLAEFIVALNAMKGTIGAAASLLVAVGAMRLFIPIVVALGTLPIMTLVQAFIALAAAFAIFGIAAKLLEPVIPNMLGVSGAMALLGLALLAIGAGLAVAGPGLISFSAGLTTFAAALITSLGIILVGLTAKFPLITVTITKGIEAIAKAIGDAAPVVIEAVVKIVIALLEGLKDLYPVMAETILELLVTMLGIFAQYAPLVANGLMELVIQTIDGIATAIYDNTDRITAAVHHLLLAILDLVLAGLQEILRGIPGVGGQISEEIGKFRDTLRDDFDKNYANKLGSDFTKGIAEGARSESDEVEAAGEETGNSLKDGLLSKSTDIPKELTGLFGEQIPESVRNSIPGMEGVTGELGEGTKASFMDSLSGLGDESGLFINQGIADGIGENSYLPEDAMSLLGTDLESSLNESLQINSPSQATWNTGMYLDQGLANGITENQGFIATAISGLATGLSNAFSAFTGFFTARGSENGEAYSKGLSGGVQSSRASGLTLAKSATSALAANRDSFGQNGSTSATNYVTAVRSKYGESKIAGAYISSSAVLGLGTARLAFSSVGTTSGTSYATGVSSRKGSARSAGQGIGNSAVQGAKSVDGFYQAGRDSGEGYISGLWSKAREMADAAAEVVRNALSAAKNAIDSNSPSKKYIELGEDSDRGYIIGVERKAKDVNAAMDKLATNAMDVFYEGISRADMVANSDLVITPTVTPVVDMNGVYGTIDYLDGMFNGPGGILGTISMDLDNNIADINRIAVTANRILSTLQRARPITIDGTTVIGWIDRELGALE